MDDSVEKSLIPTTGISPSNSESSDRCPNRRGRSRLTTRKSRPATPISPYHGPPRRAAHRFRT